MSAPRDRGPHRALPWWWALFVVAVVAVVYAVLAQSPRLVLGAAVVAATVVGAVLGVATRDSQERVISLRYALGEGLRRLGHKLWY